MTGAAAGRPVVREAGDCALLVEFDSRIDPLLNARAIAVAESVRSAALSGVTDVVPAYRSVGIYLDPLQAHRESIEAMVHSAAALVPAAIEGKLVEVPVVYGGTSGSDLEAVARWSGLSEREVIARHAGRDYRVYMLGFLPGFAYMGSVDPAIAAPRHASPRLRVRKGSVGIAGARGKNF